MRKEVGRSHKTRGIRNCLLSLATSFSPGFSPRVQPSFPRLPLKKVPGPSCCLIPHPHKLPQASQSADVWRQGSQFVVADNEHPEGQLADVGWQR